MRWILLASIFAACHDSQPRTCCLRKTLVSSCSCVCVGSVPNVVQNVPEETCAEFGDPDAGGCL